MELLELLQEKYSRMRGWYPVSIGRDNYHCDPDHISFWSKVNNGQWEPETFAIFNRYLQPDSICCDLGSWIGPTVLYGAKRCKKLYCLEPDRVAFQYLLQNISLNHLENVLPGNFALGNANSTVKIGSPRGKRGDSMSSVLRGEAKGATEVLTLCWKDWLEMIGNPIFSFMKMDVEGAEFTLIEDMAGYLEQYRPILYLSLHPHLLPEDERKVQMSRLLNVLNMYGKCMEDGARDIKLDTLMEEQAVNRAGSYLLLP